MDKESSEIAKNQSEDNENFDDNSDDYSVPS